jgi:GNAT superfamily N-acetyltransferase
MSAIPPRTDALKIEVTRTAQPDVRNLIARRLQEFNAPFPGDHPFGTLDVFVRQSDDQLVGGLVGEFAFGWFSIHVLWIEESLRGLGIGTTILDAAEDAAVANGCHSAMIETMSFQAPACWRVFAPAARPCRSRTASSQQRP